jgi:hypothetical protein
MRLQDNLHLLKGHLPSIVNCVKGAGKRLLAAGTSVALATLTGFPVLMGFIVTAQSPTHGFLEQEFYLDHISPTLA